MIGILCHTIIITKGNWLVVTMEECNGSSKVLSIQWRGQPDLQALKEGPGGNLSCYNSYE